MKWHIFWMWIFQLTIRYCTKWWHFTLQYYLNSFRKFHEFLYIFTIKNINNNKNPDKTTVSVQFRCLYFGFDFNVKFDNYVFSVDVSNSVQWHFQYTNKYRWSAHRPQSKFSDYCYIIVLQKNYLHFTIF